jgi:FtsZ-binding cell division protein ZapB
MSNEQPHDPTITIRLELGRVTDQRDAFKAALNTELLKVAKVAIYQAMLDADSKAADTIGCMGVEVDDLRKENARLKAEVDLWKLRSDNWQKLVQVTKAEVERLTKAHSDALADFWGIHKGYFDLKAEVERLKEDNRQLTNAFEIAEGIIKRMGKAAEAAAKEGKSSV